ERREPGLAEARVELERGLHHVELRYVEQRGEAILQLRWASPGGQETLVPAHVLYPRPPSEARVREDHRLVAQEQGLTLAVGGAVAIALGAEARRWRRRRRGQ
ncbi:MAG: hypothetical protein HYY85_21230, partial [Deltaproteobacteria bacterium]|nr:hypothetical protein [Deltaproteobacteria bacterium]